LRVATPQTTGKIEPWFVPRRRASTISVWRDLGALEVALHQLVGDLRDLVISFLAITPRRGHAPRQDLDLDRVVASGLRVAVGAHVDEVDDARTSCSPPIGSRLRRRAPERGL